MKQFKGTPGPWELGVPVNSYGRVIYSVSGHTGNKVITDSDPIKYGEPTILSISCREIYVHSGSFEDKENGTGWNNTASINHLANAQLIAAAPDLLEALQVLLEELENEEYVSTRMEVAQQAIKKALGL